jgi:hypothetical protein
VLGCPSVAEVNGQSIASERSLGAIAGSGSPTANTFIQVVDPDLDDELDAESEIVLAFAPAANGNLKLEGSVPADLTFTLEDLVQGDVSFEATIAEVGSDPLVEALSFDLLDGDVLVQAGASGEIQINPVNDGTPVFQNLDTTVSVEFSGPYQGTERATSPEFQVDDADGDEVALSVGAAPAKGFVTLFDPGSNYQYEYESDSARDVAGSDDLCQGPGSFSPGANRDSFTLSASDGNGPATTATVSVTLSPQTDYASIVDEIKTSQTAGGTQCATCHGAGGPGPNWTGSYNLLTGFVNLSNPENSIIFSNGQAGSGHPGGAYTFSTARRNLILQWLYECAPQF